MDSISREKAIKAIRNLWSEAWGSLDDEQTYETNEYAKGLLDAIDAVNDVLGEESEDKTMSFKWDEPMNPYAERDFAHAMKEAMKEAVTEVKHNYNEFPKDESKVVPKPIWDMPTEYSGVMRLNYLNGIGGWQDVLTVLIAHGYEVTAHIEDAIETETELENVEKWVVIEFDEVE